MVHQIIFLISLVNCLCISELRISEKFWFICGHFFRRLCQKHNKARGSFAVLRLFFVEGDENGPVALEKNEQTFLKRILNMKQLKLSFEPFDA